MKNKRLEGKKVAILATDGFEKSELFEPLSVMEKEGATVDIVSLQKGNIRSWNKDFWDEEIAVDKTINEANVNEYEGLVIPGGVINPDIMRKNKEAVEFVKEFNSGKTRKPIAAICHGPWMLAEANMLKGKRVTSYDSIKTDLTNAGASWIDKEVVCDNGIVTSRTPKDLVPFINKTIEELCEGEHKKRSA